MLVQDEASNFSTAATGTTILPSDDTIPQNTEGIEFMTLVFTPKSATDILFIEAELYLSSSVINDMTAALFQNNTASAIAGKTVYQGATSAGVTVRVTHEMTAGTTSAITFRVRGGGGLAGTTTFCGQGGSRRLGGITTSTLRVIERKG